MNARDVKRAVAPLRMIFWGGLISLFDFTFSQTTNGQGFKCDILDDTVGAILMAVGVFRLAAVPVHARYAAVMLFVQVVSVLAVLDSIRDHFIMPLPPPIEMAIYLLGLVTLVAVVAFCVAMRWWCQAAHLPAAARSWTVTTLLFAVIYLIPLGLFNVFAVLAVATGRPFNINLGPAGLLLLPVFAIPLIHLFVSTSRMKRAAEARTAEQPEDTSDEPDDEPPPTDE